LVSRFNGAPMLISSGSSGQLRPYVDVDARFRSAFHLHDDIDDVAVASGAGHTERVTEIALQLVAIA
jgi:hypothetical protein